MASVSTFHDHRATPAASVAARRCFSCQTGIVLSPDDILLLRFSWPVNVRDCPQSRASRPSSLNRKGAERHIERIEKPGRHILQLNLPLKLLTKRPHHAGAKTAPAWRLHRWTADLDPSHS